MSVPTPQRWTASELEVLRSLWIGSLPDLPPSASNAVSGDLRAAQLGKELFFEPGLSANGSVSCANCHQPERYFTDGLPRSVGAGQSSRNAPTVIGAAYAPWLFWDGRRDSLWAQALAPFETSAEMNSTRLEVVRFVTTDPRYREAYTELFGHPPDFGNPRHFPARAGPHGDAEAIEAWGKLTRGQHESVNRAFSNIGKAIAAYERLLLPGESRFDRYVAALISMDGESHHLDEREINGLRLFIDPARTLCLRCHNGPLLTNQSFHDIGTSRLGAVPDLGRFLGIQSVLLDEFNCLGPYSDAEPNDCSELRFLNRSEVGEFAGAFKTPSLRGVALTPPYPHDGRFKNLEQVIEHYRNPPPGTRELQPLMISGEEAEQLIAFLNTLSAEANIDPQWLSRPSDSREPFGNQNTRPSLYFQSGQLGR